MDEIDRAQELEMRQRRAALARQRADAQSHERPRIRNGERLCLGCGEPIAVARLRAAPNAVRCVDCQRDADRREHWRG